MARIEKKAWPDDFERVSNGKKNFDVRLGDETYSAGDTIVFKEWDPKKKAYTGRSLEKKVKYVAKTKEMPYWTESQTAEKGFVIMALE